MNQIQKSLLSAGVVFALGAGALVLASLEKKSRIESDEKAEKEKRLFDVQSEDITRVELIRPDEKLVVEKEGSDWKLREPMQAAADDATVAAMTAALATVEAKTTLTADKLDPAKVDLAQASTKVVAKTKEGKTLELWLGKKNSFDDSTYVRAGEKPSEAPLASVASHQLQPFQKTLLDLREKRLSRMNTTEVDALEVVVHKGAENAVSFKAVRSGEPGNHGFDDGWQLTSPVVAPADKEVLAQVVNTITGLRATDFVDDAGAEPAKYGLDAPAVSVTLSGAGKEETLQFSLIANGSVNKAYARRTDVPNIAEVPEGGYAAGFKDLFTLRDKRVVEFDRDAVRVIHTTLPDGKTLTLKKQVTDGSDAAWTVTAPKEGAAKGWKASSLLYALSNLKFKKFIREDVPVPAPNDVLAAYGLDAPVRTVVLEGEGGRVLAKILYGKEDLGDVFVMAEGKPVVGSVESGKLSELPGDVEEVLEGAEVEEAADDGM